MTPEQFRQRFMPPHGTVQGRMPYNQSFEAWGWRWKVRVVIDRVGSITVYYRIRVSGSGAGETHRADRDIWFDNRSHAYMLKALDEAAGIIMQHPAMAAAILEERLLEACRPGSQGGDDTI